MAVIWRHCSPTAWILAAQDLFLLMNSSAEGGAEDAPGGAHGADLPALRGSLPLCSQKTKQIDLMRKKALGAYGQDSGNAVGSNPLPGQQHPRI